MHATSISNKINLYFNIIISDNKKVTQQYKHNFYLVNV